MAIAFVVKDKLEPNENADLRPISLRFLPSYNTVTLYYK